MDNPGEILRLCRLCLVKDQVNIPIFAEQGDSREIFLKISSCLPVKVSIEDRLPKKICDGCSEKLNSVYEFWSSSANAEKTLLSWLGEDEVEEKKVQAVPKSLTASATLVKEESAELVDEAHAESIEESTKDESEAPPTKRARRSAAVKAQINLAPDSEDDDLDTTEPLTKMEEESADSDGEEKDPSYTEMPGTSADDEQAGPSGMGKDGVEAPSLSKLDPEDLNCTTCGKHYKKKSSLRLHTKTAHHSTKKFKWKTRSFVCDQCGKDFSASSYLRRHQTRHQSPKPIKTTRCTVCDKSYASIRRHYKLRHSERTARYVCDLCGQKFWQNFDLKLHTMRHRGEKPHRCPYDGCGKSFVRKQHLTLHVRSHTGEKPFVCNVCGKRYTQKPSLVVHMRGHFGEKPFGCDLCLNSFASRQRLNIHRRKVHKLVMDGNKKS